MPAPDAFGSPFPKSIDPFQNAGPLLTVTPNMTDATSHDMPTNARPGGVVAGLSPARSAATDPTNVGVAAGATTAATARSWVATYPFVRRPYCWAIARR